jgi:hypothetical protein
MRASGQLMEDDRKASRIRSRQASHRSRTAWVVSWRVFIVTSFFVVVLGANFFIGTMVMVRRFQDQTNSTGLEAYGRTARVAYPLLDGKFCRNIVFDNKTAQTIEDKVSRCDGDSHVSKRNGSAGFSWGGDER